MKIQRKLNSNTLVEAEAQTMVELFEQLSQLEEIFRQDVCGVCKGTRIGFRTREINGVKFHEAHCLNSACGAAMGFGMKKGAGGQLFPQRKNGEGKLKTNNGWAKYVPPSQQ